MCECAWCVYVSVCVRGLCGGGVWGGGCVCVLDCGAEGRGVAGGMCQKEEKYSSLKVSWTVWNGNGIASYRKACPMDVSSEMPAETNKKVHFFGILEIGYSYCRQLLLLQGSNVCVCVCVCVCVGVCGCVCVCVCACICTCADYLISVLQPGTCPSQMLIHKVYTIMTMPNADRKPNM